MYGGQKRLTYRDLLGKPELWRPFALGGQKKCMQVFCEYKGKAISVQAWMGPEVSRRLRLPGFLDSRYMKVARLSALCTGHLCLPCPPGDIPGTHFCYRLVRPQGRSAAGRIKSMKNPMPCR
jgi:hypothetical protein